MIERAYVQVRDTHHPGDEARALLEALPDRGIEVTTITRKRLVRRQLDLSPTTLVAGDLDVVPLALRMLGIEGPFLPTYPEALRPHLGRKVWRSTVGAVLDAETRVFVKPAEREKRFTGFVCAGLADAFRFQGASRKLPVWCGEVVSFTDEHRAYVVEGEVRGVGRYAGESEEPPASFIAEAIAALRRGGELVAGFALDVGRLDDGEWVVVECNEGFGLGLYPGVGADAFADLVLARWAELLSGVPT